MENQIPIVKSGSNADKLDKNSILPGMATAFLAHLPILYPTYSSMFF